MKLIILFVSLFVSVYARCKIPPRHWCDTLEIAQSCGVEVACKSFLLPQADAKPVNVTLYMESLCPDCINFMKEQFYPTWVKFKSTGIMHVDVIPYGNAHEVEISAGYYNYTCQHGPMECTGNLIENCILKYQKYDANAYMPILHCIESAKDPIAAAEKCVTDAMMDWTVIDTCARGKEGNALMHQAALITDALQPPHTYVPWVTFNGVHTEKMQQEAQKNMGKLLCDTYTGVKPSECHTKQGKLHFFPK